MSSPEEKNLTGETIHLISSGRGVRLGARIAGGGEGAVYRIEGLPDLAAKIYHAPPSKEHADKLATMVRLDRERLKAFACFPQELVHVAGKPAGFTMPFAGDRVLAHACYNAADRKKRFPKVGYDWILTVARNLAACVDEIHRQGLVIGDVNESGFLVGSTPANFGTVIAIDCDSFQVRSESVVYPCVVGKPEYTPPELLQPGANTRDRVPNQDNFGLAVLLFQLLMMGRHPFAGVEAHQGDIAEAIKAGSYAYGPGARHRRLTPPPASIPVEMLGTRVVGMLEEAFCAGPGRARPTAVQWVAALDELRSGLGTCADAKDHRFPNAFGQCPWCDFFRQHLIEFFPIEPKGFGKLQYDFSFANLFAAFDSVQTRIREIRYAVINPTKRPVNQNAVAETAAYLKGKRVQCVSEIKKAAIEYRELWEIQRNYQKQVQTWEEEYERIEKEYFQRSQEIAARKERARQNRIHRHKGRCEQLERDYGKACSQVGEQYQNELKIIKERRDAAKITRLNNYRQKRDLARDELRIKTKAIQDQHDADVERVMAEIARINKEKERIWAEWKVECDNVDFDNSFNVAIVEKRRWEVSKGFRAVYGAIAALGALCIMVSPKESMGICITIFTLPTILLCLSAMANRPWEGERFIRSRPTKEKPEKPRGRLSIALPDLPPKPEFPKLQLPEEPLPSGDELLPDPPVPKLPHPPILPEIPGPGPEELLANPEREPLPPRPQVPPQIAGQSAPMARDVLEKISAPFLREISKVQEKARFEAETRSSQADVLKREILTELEWMDPHVAKFSSETKSAEAEYRKKEAEYSSLWNRTFSESQARGRQVAFDAYLRSVSIYDFVDTFPRLSKLLAQTMDAYGVTNAHELITQVLEGPVKIPQCGPVTKASLRQWIDMMVIPNFRLDANSSLDTTALHRVNASFASMKGSLERRIRGFSGELDAVKKRLSQTQVKLNQWEQVRDEIQNHEELVSLAHQEHTALSNIIVTLGSEGHL